MGLLTMLSNSQFGLKGATPPQRAGAKPSSQLHAQGTSMKPNHSRFDLDGLDQGKYETQVGDGKHVEIEANNSALDLDGGLPKRGTYRENAPEGANF